LCIDLKEFQTTLANYHFSKIGHNRSDRKKGENLFVLELLGTITIEIIVLQ